MGTKITKEADDFGNTLATATTIRLSASNDVYVIYGTVGGAGGDEDHFLVDSTLAASACAMAITHVAPNFGASFRVSLVDNEYARTTKNLLYSTPGTHYLSDLRTSWESLSWTPWNALDEIVVRAPEGTQREAYMLLLGDAAKVQSMYQGLLANVTGNDATGSMTIVGTSGDDYFSGMSANSIINGGVGIDSVLVTGSWSANAINKSTTGYDVSTTEGTTALSNVERLLFDDKKIALDVTTDGNTGKALEFIGAVAYGLVRDKGAIGCIQNLFDAGSSLLDVCHLALDVGLIRSLAGSDSNEDLARLAYQNVVGTPADTAAVDMLVSFMDGRTASYSQATFLTVVAELELNQEHVGLVGLAETGVEYA
jgi:hypothetical protein